MNRITMLILYLAAVMLLLSQSATPQTQANNASSLAKDPGVRGIAVNAGQALSTLSPSQLAYFNDGLARFNEVDQVENGLGPTFNSNSCGSCHSQPAAGGTSPKTDQYPNIGPNPQIEAASASGATNKIPSVIYSDGPVREARFPFAANPKDR